MSDRSRIDGIMFGGLAGGAAEMVVVAAYALLAGVGGLVVAEGVSQTVFGDLFRGGDAVLMGTTVHFALSFLIAACFVPLAPHIARRFGRNGVVLAATAALLAVWAFNFLVLLPRIAPEFVALVPLSVSFASKLAFGVALGLALVSRPRLGVGPRRTYA